MMLPLKTEVELIITFPQYKLPFKFPDKMTVKTLLRDVLMGTFCICMLKGLVAVLGVFK